MRRRIWYLGQSPLAQQQRLLILLAALLGLLLQLQMVMLAHLAERPWIAAVRLMLLAFLVWLLLRLLLLLPLLLVLLLVVPPAHQHWGLRTLLMSSQSPSDQQHLPKQATMHGVQVRQHPQHHFDGQSVQSALPPHRPPR
jgi:hypothetical protein